MIMTHIQISWMRKKGAPGSGMLLLHIIIFPMASVLILLNAPAPDPGIRCDFVIADKDRVFLNHHSADFSFVGADREVTSIDNIQQYMHIPDFIRSFGLPNYRQSRIPLRSGLNLEAWEYRLCHYPDKFLFQNIKIGFPLSIVKLDLLCNSQIKNHPSVLACPFVPFFLLDQKMVIKGE